MSWVKWAECFNLEVQKDCAYSVEIKGKEEFACLYSSSFRNCQNSLIKRGRHSNFNPLGGSSDVYELYICPTLRKRIAAYNSQETNERRMSSGWYSSHVLVEVFEELNAQSSIEKKMESGEIDKKQGAGNLILLDLWPNPIRKSKDVPQFEADFCRQICELALEDKLKLEVSEYKADSIQEALSSL